MVLCLVALPAAPVGADFWSENLEIHGRLSSRAYFRSPGLSFGSNDVQLSSWRNELWLETYLRLHETNDFRAELTAVLRPVYEGAYDLYPDTWGQRPDGGAFGTATPSSQDRALRGKPFAGNGTGILGEYFAVNQDLASVVSGELRPGLALNPLLIANSGVAPWATRGSLQPHVGGSAAASSFLSAIAGGAPGAPELMRSLDLAGTTVAGSADRRGRPPSKRC